MRGTDASTYIPTVEVGDMMSTGRAIPHDSVPHSNLQSLLKFFPWNAASKYNDGSTVDSLDRCNNGCNLEQCSKWDVQSISSCWDSFHCFHDWIVLFSVVYTLQIPCHLALLPRLLYCFCSIWKLWFSFSSSHSFAFWVRVYVAVDGLAVPGGKLARDTNKVYGSIGARPVLILDQSDRHTGLPISKDKKSIKRRNSPFSWYYTTS